MRVRDCFVGRAQPTHILGLSLKVCSETVSLRLVSGTARWGLLDCSACRVPSLALMPDASPRRTLEFEVLYPAQTRSTHSRMRLFSY